MYWGGGAFLADPKLLFPFCIYLALNCIYSLGLKNYALIDVFMISLGFIIRLFIGSMSVDIELSHWIVITTFFLSLFLAFAKRRDDVLLFCHTGEKMRKSIEGYNLGFVDACLVISAVMSILSYVMWSISEPALAHFSSYLYLTSLFVVLGILRYLQLVFVDCRGGSPTEVVLTDKALHLIVIGWMMSFVILYFWRF